jgi:hypothetical protein
MAEFERKLIRERTLAGLRAALAGADLHVPSGGITGLLGPRGGVGPGGSHGTAMRHSPTQLVSYISSFAPRVARGTAPTDCSAAGVRCLPAR